MHRKFFLLFGLNPLDIGVVVLGRCARTDRNRRPGLNPLDIGVVVQGALASDLIAPMGS